MATSSVEEEVREASDRFNDALEALLNGDASPLVDVWSHEDDVTGMLPVGGREEGWDALSGTQEEFAAALMAGTVTHTDQLIRVIGDLAYELCTESLSATFAGEPMSLEHRATRVYRKENDEWKVVHYHTDLDAEFAKKVATMGA